MVRIHQGPLLFTLNMKTWFLALVVLLSASVGFAQIPPESLATGGDGSEDAPWTSTRDFTGGIQSAIDRLEQSRGGEVRLAAGRYDFTSSHSMVTIRRPGIRLACAARGYSVDPNGVAEGTTGCKIKVTAPGSAITLGQTKGQPRLGGQDVDAVYIWGAGTNACSYPFTTCSGVRVTGDLDQSHFNNMVFANLGCGFTLDRSGSLDSVKIQNSSFDGNGTGISLQSTDPYTAIQDNIIADNALQGIAANRTHTVNRLTISGNIFVRNCSACRLLSANVLWMQDESRIVDNNFSEAGGAAGGRVVKADQILLYGSDNVITGNFFGYSDDHRSIPPGNAAVHIVRGANRNLIGPNHSKNQPVDVVVDEGALDTVIDWPGVRIIDNGSRTVINHLAMNPGDPDTTEPWKSGPKYPGLMIRDTLQGRTWLYTGNASGARVSLGGEASGPKRTE